ncbi:MAG TPA: MFS transporter [Mycobacteriales bacterium]|nr:MFS transporter [Mycobacteriales bacterium]
MTGTRERTLAVRLLSTHDYRNYWLGSTAFAIGIWAFLVSMGYSAKQLTDSPFRVSLVSVAYFAPMFLLALPSGVLADRRDRKHIVIACRGASSVVALVLALMVGTGTLGYAALLVLCALTGATVVLEIAARQAFITHIVAPDEVAGAAALGSVQGGLARVLGPLVVGGLIASLGQAAGYFFFALANAFCVWVFLRIRASGAPEPSEGRPLADLVEGLRYLRGHADALTVVSVGVLSGVVGWLYIALLPSVNHDTLHGGAVQLSVLSAAIGVGSVPPSVLLALRSGSPPYEGALFYGATVVWGLSVVVYGTTSSTTVAFVALVASGAGNGLQQVLLRTLLLRLTEPAFHGRVMGTLMLTWGANVLGTLAGGGLAERYGVATVIAASGGLIVAVAAGALLRRPSTLRL